MWGADDEELEAPGIGRLRAALSTVGVIGAAAAALVVFTSLLAGWGTLLFPAVVVAAVGGLIAAIACGSLALYFAPRYTASLVAVLGVVMFVSLPIPCWLLKSREASRNAAAMNHLRQFGVRMLHSTVNDPGRHEPVDEPVPEVITLSSHQPYPVYEP
jgi:hypothetical protein